ncbi:putative E3 ubiquitin-protein ligase UBR7 [Ornithodoros turicata]|uniref:putative E3 ubiquitin-protein ligase UBR7 n=1 Tax=Ornithodoros turicata TaxID=34597 RepID=UPI003138F8DA
MADSSEAKSVPPTAPEVLDENSLTLQDILDEEEELEEDANAVLGGSDDKNCTYAQGYVNRQALYACITCVPPNAEPAGVCLACSYACHEGHELYELYTKRNFRCDCGNSHFPSSNQCRLFPVKDSINEKNNYNHNFHGRYCTCGRPYPDPEDDVNDEMLQCIMCEDWYHGRHLGDRVPDNRDYSEMICLCCMGKHSFLWKYYKNAIRIDKKGEDGSANISLDVTNSQCSKPADIYEKAQKDAASISNGDTKDGLSCTNGEKNDRKEALLHSAAKQETVASECLYMQLPAVNEDKLTSRSTFWPSGWRSTLCRCSSCVAMYKEQQCSYLLEDDDTVQAYEERGKEKRGEMPQGDPLMSALGTLGRVQQIEAIHGYNNLKTELTDFLKKFADTRKVVREEDVREFFGQMQARKRQRVSTVPHFCR